MQADIVEQERAQRAQCGLWMRVAVLQRLQFCAARMQRLQADMQLVVQDALRVVEHAQYQQIVVFL